MEVRGVGILPFAYRPRATIRLVVELAVDPDAGERLPEPRQTVISDVTLPIYRLNPRPASAPIKVELLAARLEECP